MWTSIKQILFLFIVGWLYTWGAFAQQVEVNNTTDLLEQISKAKPGNTFLLNDGDYPDIKLIVKTSGTPEAPITIKAKHPGKVSFSGDAKVALYGNYIVISGISFKNGNRKQEEWRTHGPGLVAIYGSHNRITQCAFHCFDQANSAYITTSIPENGNVPQYCRIDHCSFTEKITFDQVINLNNTLKKSTKGQPGIAMYHRIDHCFFANPRKPGNAGGGIRIGYWRKDDGRCLVDSNLFMRQDSEPEIITSKSKENVYYGNTFQNCRGTLNFRHGDKQVAINNFFIGTDQKQEYGGLFVWGSEHLIAANHFQLPTTLSSRGNAALYLNPGAKESEHALAYNILICNNTFGPINGYAIHFHPLMPRRQKNCQKQNQSFKLPHTIQLNNNTFWQPSTCQYPLFNNDHQKKDAVIFEHNISNGVKQGMKIKTGLDAYKKTTSVYALAEKHGEPARIQLSKYLIKGIPSDIFEAANQYLDAEPLTWAQVGPDWLKEIPGTYAKTGKLTKEVQQQFKVVIHKRAK